MLPRLQGVSSIGITAAGVVLVGEDLLDFVEQLVALADDGAGGARRRAVPHHGTTILMRMRHLQGGGRLALELDHDAAELLGAMEGQNDPPCDEVEVGVELGPVVEGYPERHDLAHSLLLASLSSQKGGVREVG